MKILKLNGMLTVNLSMMKNFKKKIKIMEEKGQVIIFKDLLESQFNGDYDDMLNWLNEHNRLKEVIYIANGGTLYGQKNRPYIVDEYRPGDIKVLVYVIMVNGEHGNAKGLVFINNDFVGKEDLGDDDIGIKWYVNGRLIDDKEF